MVKTIGPGFKYLPGTGSGSGHGPERVAVQLGARGWAAGADSGEKINGAPWGGTRNASGGCLAAPI